MNSGTQRREQLLFQYSQALERGDFEQVAAVLQLAEADPLLEQAIGEINAAQAVALGILAPEPVRPVEQAAVPSPQPAPDSARRGPGAWAYFWKRLDRAFQSLGEWRYLPQSAAVMAVLLLIAVVMLSNNTLNAGQVATPAGSVGTGTVGTGGQAASSNASAPGETVLISEASSAIPPDDSGAQSGYISLIASDLTKIREEIQAFINSMSPDGAAVVSSTENFIHDPNAPNLSLEVRVPSASYEDTMRQLANLADRVLVRVDRAATPSKELDSLQTRIDQLTTSRQRLSEIVERAATTEDKLMAEKELSQREAELQDLESQHNQLAQSTSFAKVYVDIRITRPSTVAWNPQETVQEALHSLSNTWRNLVDGSITFAITILPWALPIAAVLYGLRKAANRRKEE